MPDDPRLTHVRLTLQQLLPTPSVHERSQHPESQSAHIGTAMPLNRAANTPRQMKG
jgi:hypothetical protein